MADRGLDFDDPGDARRAAAERYESTAEAEARANEIKDQALRQSFLENVAAHCQIVREFGVCKDELKEMP